MSQSLDALGSNSKNRPKPSWRLLPFSSALSTILPESDTTLENIIHSRGCKKDCDGTKTSKESTKVTCQINPMGHTVMVANSKSDPYTKLNNQGRPVIDKLADED